MCTDSYLMYFDQPQKLLGYRQTETCDTSREVGRGDNRRTHRFCLRAHTPEQAGHMAAQITVHLVKQRVPLGNFETHSNHSAIAPSNLPPRWPQTLARLHRNFRWQNPSALRGGTGKAQNLPRIEHGSGKSQTQEQEVVAAPLDVPLTGQYCEGRPSKTLRVLPRFAHLPRA